MRVNAEISSLSCGATGGEPTGYVHATLGIRDRNTSLISTGESKRRRINTYTSRVPHARLSDYLCCHSRAHRLS